MLDSLDLKEAKIAITTVLYSDKTYYKAMIIFKGKKVLTHKVGFFIEDKILKFSQIYPTNENFKKELVIDLVNNNLIEIITFLQSLKEKNHNPPPEDNEPEDYHFGE